jgi:hypothetical protein
MYVSVELATSAFPFQFTENDRGHVTTHPA